MCSTLIRIFSSLGSCLRLRTEADFAGDHGGAEFSLGPVVFGRDVATIGPMIEPIGAVSENILDVADS